MTGQVVGEKTGILKGSLSKLEICFYFLGWTFAILYSSFSFYVSQNEIYDEYYVDLYDDFNEGWTWIDRKIDVADPEWTFGMIVFDAMLPFLFVHLFISELLKNNTPEFLPLWHTITGSLFVLFNFGWIPLLLFCMLPLVYFYFIQYSKTAIIWVIAVLVCVVSHYVFHSLDDNQEVKILFTSVTLAWINLRCISYFLDAIEEKKYQKFNVINFFGVLGYCLYLPLLYFGPIINYTDFVSSQWKSRDKKDRVSIFTRGKKLLLSTIRFGVWFVVIQFFLHFFYVNALLFQIEFVKYFDGFSLYAFGYLMGEFFHMKYVVLYGLSTALTHFELEISVPPPPKCVSRIHLYSYMWKHFDRGLYLFLVKYIYRPLIKCVGKVVSSLMTFVFIFFWHGLHPSILIWTTLNYIGVSLESLSSSIIKLDIFQNSFINKLSTNNKRRFNCMVATPLFIMSLLSNFYFFSGRTYGDLFVYKFINGTPTFQFIIMCVVYCGCQISTEIQLIENDKCSFGVTIEKGMEDKLCSGDHKPNLNEKFEKRSRGPLQKRFTSRSGSPKKLYEKFHKTCAKLNRLGLSKKFDLYKKQSIEKIISNHLLTKSTEPPAVDEKNDEFRNEFQQIIDEINTEKLQINFNQISDELMNEIKKKIDELLNIDETKINELKKIL